MPESTRLQQAVERNLLAGSLALETGLLPLESLVAGIRVWAADKQQTLERVLVAQGLVSAAQADALEQLVCERIGTSLSDPERACTALALPDSLVRELRALSDTAIHTTLDYATVSPDCLPPLPVETVDPPASRAAPMRYRSLRPHARGGLGEVFVALDRELHREVALKEIQKERANDPDCRARFLLEAEITGGLEHPGIVPVYGLGSYADGRPYYAMRFIQGETLRDAVRRFHEAPPPENERGLELRQLLTRFVAVCNAVAYAHSRRVLHRDIKPANIMLGKYGETLLVDWGIAKALAARPDGLVPRAEQTLKPMTWSELSTLQGDTLGTPSFMSPEQATGEVERLGPATDIYSLGATLYALLTGRAPVLGENASAILQRVRIGDWQPPRLVNKSVPAPLNAICCKAMAMKPEARYATALDLAAEIEHWLADEPVAAYREPWTGRARRWMRRRRALVASAAVLLGVGVVALAVIAVLINQARKNSVAEQARTEEQRRRAKTNLDRAMTAVDQMLTRVGEKQLAQIPQFDEERRKILQDALQLSRDMLDDNSTVPDVQLQTAKAYLRSGDINRLLGRPQEAEQAFQRALELLERLTTMYPGEPEYQDTLAKTYTSLARSYHQTGKLDLARESCHKGVVIAERLVTEHPEEARYQQTLAAVCNGAGLIDRDTGHPAEAEAALKRANSLYVQLAQESASPAEFESRRAACQNNLGWLYRNIGRIDDAEKAYQGGVSILERLRAQDPKEGDYQRVLARLYENLGMLYPTLGRNDQARTSTEKALALRERMAAEHPSVLEYQRDLAGCQSMLGWIFQSEGRLADAEAVGRKALDTRQRLDREQPANPHERWELAFSLHQMGWLYQHSQRIPEAEKCYQDAVVIREALVRGNPNSPDFQSDLGDLYHELGMLHHERTRDFAKSEAAYQKALEIRERLHKRHETVPKYQNDLAWTYQHLVNLWLDSDQIAKAAAVQQRVRGLREQLVADHPKVPDYEMGLAVSHRQKGRLLLAQGDAQGALDEYARAVPIQERILERQPKQPEARDNLANAYAGRARALTRLGRHEDALSDFDRALKTEPGRGSTEVRLDRAVVLARLGEHAKAAAEAKELTDKAPDALALFQAARVYALAAAALSKASPPASIVPAEKAKQAEQYASRAVELLKQARTSGYFKKAAPHLEELRKDADFSSLGARPEFQTLLVELDKEARRQ